MRYKKQLKQQVQKEFSERSYAFRSEMFLISERLVTELISKAFAAEFIRIIKPGNTDEDEYETVRLRNTGTKSVRFKFHKSVNYSSRSEKAGQPKEITDNLFTLKTRYGDVTTLEDIVHCETHVELTAASETDKDLRIIFKVHPEDTDPEFSYDLSIRFYREFFELTDTIES